MPGCDVPARLTAAARPFALTGRELQVLTLTAQGEPVKIIADRLEISARTVVFHREHICGKIGKPTLAAVLFEMLF